MVPGLSTWVDTDEGDVMLAGLGDVMLAGLGRYRRGRCHARRVGQECFPDFL